jgi:hypothetical protein
MLSIFRLKVNHLQHAIPPNGWDASGLCFEGATTGALIGLELLGSYGGGRSLVSIS